MSFCHTFDVCLYSAHFRHAQGGWLLNTHNVKANYFLKLDFMHGRLRTHDILKASVLVLNDAHFSTFPLSDRFLAHDGVSVCNQDPVHPVEQRSSDKSCL